MRRRFLFIITILILLAAIFSLAKTIYKTYLAGQRIKAAENEVQLLLARQQELKQELSAKDTLEFVEKQARDKLAMVKEGETIVVVGENGVAQSSQGSSTSSSLTNLSNPEKWWRLFFGNE